MLTWGRGLSKKGNKNADILYAMPLRKSKLFFGLQIDVFMKFLSKRGADFLAKFALCFGRKCCLAIDRKEEG